jgi:hypothetical protein
MAEKFRINEYGEIIREDYFFRQVQNNQVQFLPFERKVWKIYLLSLLTLGIYGIVVQWAMAKETNISCVEDGKHTRGFWGTLGLSIITFGIYGIIWAYKWLNREANYLERHEKSKVLSGGTYLFIQIINIILSYVMAFSGSDFGTLISIVIGIIVLTLLVKQHNTVNALYNEINNFVSKA